MNSPSTPVMQAQSPQQAKVKVVAGYALQQKLGSGSFAIVYKGVKVQPQGNSQDFAAIKAIARASEKLTKKVLQNLEMEISILRTYRHRNIVCMHDVQKTANHFYLVLEYCSGGDVQGLIRSRKARRLSEGLTRRLMRDLAHGLAFLWKQNLIHRDIKPQNLLLTGPLPFDELDDPECTTEADDRRRIANFSSQEFCLKIADFGFARHLQSTSLAETLCGSPLYMAPEILQHHRYDAKADLWSVGTVLFEMISGEPPFHGENHIDLLRNIQRKAVRLPKDVRVSKECVNLLRILLSRNPLSRAGFKEFFEACDAFVALGCQGLATVDEGSCKRPSIDLGTIPEYSATTTTASSQPPMSESVMTATTHSTLTQPPRREPVASEIAPPNPSAISPQTIAMTKPRSNLFNPLGMYSSPATHDIMSPAMTELPTIHSKRMPQPIEMPTRSHEVVSTLQNSTDENSFVMVEHGSSLHKSALPVVSSEPPPPTTAMVSHYGEAFQHKDGLRQLENSPPSSPGFFLNRIPILPTRTDFTIVKGAKGMLSTSPGTGGTLMGILTGRPRLLSAGTTPPSIESATDYNNSEKQLEQRFKSAAKMLATAEDIGRRAITVAHLGDKRAYCAMRLVMMNESNASSTLSVIPMEGIEEEGSGDHDSGTVTDDSSSTEIMTSARRRRSSASLADKSMPDVKNAEDEEDEMPFAVPSESATPLLTAGMPSRSGSSLNNKDSQILNRKSVSKPSPAIIRTHFNEALTCYVKALSMLKGALSATEGVLKEISILSDQRLTSEQQTYVLQLKKRCEVTSNWLGSQFQGVLDRGDSANMEINKLPQEPAADLSSSKQNFGGASVEELLYTHALGYGREGAVKQLLGHYESARSCYRSAGLLAETLLMEPRVEGDDRKTLESYVDGFAAQITELDALLLLQQSQSRLVTSSSAAGSSMVSTRRGALSGVGGGSSQAPAMFLPGNSNR